jgi:predicted component of type VI protein secretion system
MMAFDRTPSHPTLAPETVEALRQSLTRSARQGNHSDDLRDLLCNAAAEARDKGIQAERLLLILKDIWYGLPQVASATSSDAENALLQELISRCIQQYYAE